MTTILSSAAVFVGLMLVLRTMGKRELSEMTAFDLVMLFVIGDIVAESVISEDTSLVGALVATATFAVLTVLLSWLSSVAALTAGDRRDALPRRGRRRAGCGCHAT